MCNNSPAVATSLENGWRNQGQRQGVVTRRRRHSSPSRLFDYTRVEHWTACWIILAWNLGQLGDENQTRKMLLKTETFQAQKG